MALAALASMAASGSGGAAGPDLTTVTTGPVTSGGTHWSFSPAPVSFGSGKSAGMFSGLSGLPEWSRLLITLCLILIGGAFALKLAKG